MLARKIRLADISSINLKVYERNSAKLIAIQHGKEIPWKIERVFFINSRNVEERGDHAHLNGFQAFICITGSAKLVCKDGFKTQEIEIEAFDQVILVPPGIWVNLELKESTSIAVMTNLAYDEKDYIYKWRQFLEFKGHS